MVAGMFRLHMDIGVAFGVIVGFVARGFWDRHSK